VVNVANRYVPARSSTTAKLELLPLTDGIITVDTLQITASEKGNISLFFLKKSKRRTWQLNAECCQCSKCSTLSRKKKKSVRLQEGSVGLLLACYMSVLEGLVVLVCSDLQKLISAVDLDYQKYIRYFSCFMSYTFYLFISLENLYKKKSLEK